jgi:uncharacterized protein
MNRLSKLPFSKIQLSGIHQDLLRRQWSGLSSHIGEVFPDLSDDSAWLGGSGEQWERGPYYLDGLIPLAYLLQDAAAIQKANQWLEAILQSQDETGFFGPKTNRDWWPRAVVLKAMVSAYLATEDPRIATFLRKYFAYMEGHLPNTPFAFWGYARGLEGLEAIQLLEDLDSTFDGEHLFELWKRYALDWTNLFTNYPYEEPTGKYLNQQLFHLLRPLILWLDKLAKNKKKPKLQTKEQILANNQKPLNQVYLKTHGVNLAMAFKYVLYAGGDEDAFFAARDEILKHHGNALELFSSDEHVNGPSPEQGVELCVVVEQMHSLEEAMRLTTSMRAADALDYVAYNALLTTITPDFCAHQYVQQVNQLDASVKKHPFFDTDRYANTFGVAPNFGCCAANMHQGWPKYFASAVMQSKNGIVVFLYVSGIYEVSLETGTVRFEVLTKYPYESTVRIVILEHLASPETTMTLRLPYRAKTSYTYQSKKRTIAYEPSLTLDHLIAGDQIDLEFDFPIQVVTNQDATISVRKGPLLYALPLQATETKLFGSEPFHDRAFTTNDDSYWVPLLEYRTVSVISSQTDPVSNLPTLTIEGIHLQTQERKPITLIPYGHTILRVAQFIRKDLPL